MWIAHCQIPGNKSANSIGILNAHTQLRLASKERGFGAQKHKHLERQSSHTGRFLLADALNCILLAQCQLININKLASNKEQSPTR
jgi:hypothetical protein